MRPAATAIAFSGLAAAAMLFLSFGDKIDGSFEQPVPFEVPQQQSPATLEESIAEALAQTKQSSDEPSQAAPVTASPTPPRIRPVQPGIITVPPVDLHQLERVEPREPLSPLGRAHAPSEGPPRQTLLHRPVATDSATVNAMGHTVRLAQVRPVSVEETCDSGGLNWPCGIHARTAFRNWLRGRAISCVVPPVPDGQIVVSDCVVGEQNPAEWLVAQGWAHAEPGSAYEQAEADARTGRRGIYGSPPAQNNTLTITVPELPATVEQSGD